MSSTSAPPAKKTKIKSSKIESSKKVSDLFPLSSEVDIFVRSRAVAHKVTLFGTNKVFLQATSPVFRDVLQVGHPAETHESIPIIDVDDHPLDLELFLVHVHPGKLILPNGDLRDLAVRPGDLLDVARITEKYDAPLVLHSLLSTYLPIFYGPNRELPTDGINAFGLALVYNSSFHVRAALRSFAMQKPDMLCNDSDDDNDRDEGRPVRRARQFNLSHMDRDILEKLSLDHIVEFSRVAGKIGSKYTWADAARDFRVSRWSSLCFFSSFLFLLLLLLLTCISLRSAPVERRWNCLSGTLYALHRVRHPSLPHVRGLIRLAPQVASPSATPCPHGRTLVSPALPVTITMTLTSPVAALRLSRVRV